MVSSGSAPGKLKGNKRGMGGEMEGKSKKAEYFVKVALLTMFVGRCVTIEAMQKINGQVKPE